MKREDRPPNVSETKHRGADMGRYRTADEVEEEHSDNLGPTLGPLYHELYNELCRLHLKWNQYCALFGKSEDRVALLNTTAADFFGLLQGVLWEDVLLHIARLTDTPGRGDHKRITLHRLPNEVDDPHLSNEVKSLIDRASHLSEFAREWRNRHIAHRDLSLSLNDSAKPLASASRKHVKEALAALDTVMNSLETHYFQSEIRFECVSAREDAEVLIHRLAIAARLEERRMKRLREGNPLPEDVEPPPDI